MLQVNWFGLQSVFHHVGLAVKSIQEIIPAHALPITDPIQKVKVQFIDVHGVTIELLEPLDDSSPVLRSLSQQQFLLHLCFRVPSIKAALEEGRQHGFVQISKISPAPALENKHIVFVLSPIYGVVELLEQ